MRLFYRWNEDAQKILVTATYAGVELELYEINDNNLIKEDSNHENGMYEEDVTYPLLELEGEDGLIFTITESNAIVRYLLRLREVNNEAHNNNTNNNNNNNNHNNNNNIILYGLTPFESSQIDSWMDFSLSELDRVCSVYEENYNKSNKKLRSVKEVLQGLETYISTRTFLVGERLTLADIVVAFSIKKIYSINKKDNNSFVYEYPQIYRLYSTVMNQKTVISVLQDIENTEPTEL